MARRVMRKPAAILISGRGSNMEALLQAARDPAYPVGFELVISNRPGAAGLERATRHGVPAIVVDHRGFADRDDFEDRLDAELRARRIELVCLAGFMRLLGRRFVESWRDRIVNIHPSLLPAFPGLDSHARALAAGVRFAGCTVHVVRAATDDGPIIGQAVVAVLPSDDADALAARVLAAEHRLYPAALALLASGAARVEGERVVLAPGISVSPLAAQRPD